MYKCTHFKLQELFPPEMMGMADGELWSMLDSNLLKVIDRLRDDLGKSISINTWSYGGKFSLRGFRPANSKVGAAKSPHKRGKGLDFDVKGMTAQEVRDYIIANQAKYPEIKRMEDKVNWVHIDTIPVVGAKKIVLFNP